jgi:GNAT superfamily N-acetyltransferase
MDARVFRWRLDAVSRDFARRKTLDWNDSPRSSADTSAVDVGNIGSSIFAMASIRFFYSTSHSRMAPLGCTRPVALGRESIALDQQSVNRRVRYLRPHQVAAYYASRGLHRPLEFHAFHALRLVPRTGPAAPPSPSDLEVGFVGPDVLRRAASDRAAGLDPAEVDAALERGEECFGAWSSGVLVSHAWFAPGWTHLRSGVFVRFDAPYAYCRWAFTRPEHRGRCLHGAIKRRALDAFARRGIRGVLSFVDVVNFESLNSAARVGCRRVGLLLTYVLAGRRAVWASPGCMALELRIAIPGKGYPEADAM